MKIVVCIKQVPDTSEVEIDPITNTLIRTGIPLIINPDDKAAIETALSLKDAHKDATVTVLSMGPMQAKLAIAEALAMGCDEGVLVSGREFGGSDTLATSSIIAAALKKIGYDVIIAGRQAIDGDTAQVGPQIAEHLSIPQVTYVEELSLEGDALIALRQFEDRYHKVKIKMPCLITAISGAKEERYMTVSGIIEAEKKEITILDYAALEDILPRENIGLKGSPTSVAKSYTKEPKGQGTILKGLTTNEAVDAIMSRLHEGHIV